MLNLNKIDRCMVEIEAHNKQVEDLKQEILNLITINKTKKIDFMAFMLAKEVINTNNKIDYQDMYESLTSGE